MTYEQSIVLETIEVLERMKDIGEIVDGYEDLDIKLQMISDELYHYTTLDELKSELKRIYNTYEQVE